MNQWLHWKPLQGKPVKVPSRGWITPDKDKMNNWIKEGLGYTTKISGISLSH